MSRKFAFRLEAERARVDAPREFILARRDRSLRRWAKRIAPRSSLHSSLESALIEGSDENAIFRSSRKLSRARARATMIMSARDFPRRAKFRRELTFARRSCDRHTTHLTSSIASTQRQMGRATRSSNNSDASMHARARARAYTLAGLLFASLSRASNQLGGSEFKLHHLPSNGRSHRPERPDRPKLTTLIRRYLINPRMFRRLAGGFPACRSINYA